MRCTQTHLKAPKPPPTPRVSSSPSQHSEDQCVYVFEAAVDQGYLQQDDFQIVSHHRTHHVFTAVLTFPCNWHVFLRKQNKAERSVTICFDAFICEMKAFTTNFLFLLYSLSRLFPSKLWGPPPPPAALKQKAGSLF